MKGRLQHEADRMAIMSSLWKQNPKQNQRGYSFEKLSSLAENGQEKFKLTYAQIEGILGFPIDHSFLKFKKELLAYGYQVVKISMKEETVGVERVRL